MQFDREPGFFSAAMAVNYVIVCVFYLLPLLLIWLIGWLPGRATIIMCFLGAGVVPILTYRYSQSIWLGFYYYITSAKLDEEM